MLRGFPYAKTWSGVKPGKISSETQGREPAKTFLNFISIPLSGRRCDTLCEKFCLTFRSATVTTQIAKKPPSLRSVLLIKT